jgi:hypothetical protein
MNARGVTMPRVILVAAGRVATRALLVAGIAGLELSPPVRA